MEEASRRGKELSRPWGGRSPATSGFGLLTGVEEAYRALAVEVVKAAVVDYAEGVRLSQETAQSRKPKSWRDYVPRHYGRALFREWAQQAFLRHRWRVSHAGDGEDGEG